MAASVEMVDVDAETVDPNEVSPMEEENDENRNPEMSELQSSGFIAFGILQKCSIKSSYNAGADLGGGGCSRFLCQGFDPMPNQRVPPWYYFEIPIFG